MEKLSKLQQILSEIGRGVIAFSGGCDSAFLLRVAHDVLKERVVALTAISSTMAPWEREEAAQIARLIGVHHIEVDSHEMEREEYRANPANRCFFCKDELFTLALQEAKKLDMGVVMDGSNRDDRGDHRPGRIAAQKHGVRSPLDEAELTKEEIRQYSRTLGLPTWDKPAIACLASRFPYGTSITHERLARIAACEEALREFGFRQFRARYHDSILRLEIDAAELPRALEPSIRNQLVERCKAQGFLYIALDLQGYRSGSLNEVLSRRHTAATD